MPARRLSAQVPAGDVPLKVRRRRETLEQRAVRARQIAARLAGTYHEIVVPLNHRNTFELLVATILSAQCTDEAVNRVTPELFRRYPNPAKLAVARSGEIEKIIRPLGLYRGKARALKDCARQLVEAFNGEVPESIEDLTRLAGVGRKTANVIRGYAFGIPGIVVDTHCKRLALRLGLTGNDDPARIERDLNVILPEQDWTAFSHRLIIHGRKVCHARKPNCKICAVSELCPSREV